MSQLGSVSHRNSSATFNVAALLVGTLHPINIIFTITTVLLGRNLVKDREFDILEGLLLIGHREPFNDVG